MDIQYTDFRIFLYNSDNKPIIPLKKFLTYELAINEIKDIAIVAEPGSTLTHPTPPGRGIKSRTQNPTCKSQSFNSLEEYSKLRPFCFPVLKGESETMISQYLLHKSKADPLPSRFS